MTVDENALRWATLLVESGNEATEPICAKCGDHYSLREGCTPSEFCDVCVHRVAEALAAVVCELVAQIPREPFDVRCADALADEVAVLIDKKLLDSRSPAAGALLDYRNPLRSPRSDRLRTLEADLDTTTNAYRAILSMYTRLKASIR